MSGEGNNRSGAMIPIPQYPFYPAMLAELDGRMVIELICKMLFFITVSVIGT